MLEPCCHVIMLSCCHVVPYQISYRHCLALCCVASHMHLYHGARQYCKLGLSRAFYPICCTVYRYSKVVQYSTVSQRSGWDLLRRSFSVILSVPIQYTTHFLHRSTGGWMRNNYSTYVHTRLCIFSSLGLSLHVRKQIPSN